MRRVEPSRCGAREIDTSQNPLSEYVSASKACAAGLRQSTDRVVDIRPKFRTEEFEDVTLLT